MIYRFNSTKAKFIETLAQKLIDDKTFEMISSNTANDHAITTVASDGYVFKSTEVINGAKFIFGFKNFDIDIGAMSTSIYWRIAEQYDPNITPNTNGTWGPGTGWKTMYLTAQAQLTLDAMIECYLDVKPHRVILITWNAKPTLETPNIAYIGYPELSTCIEKFYMQNLMFISSNNNMGLNQPYVAIDFLNNKWQAHRTYSLIAPINPNVIGDYNMSPIYVGNTDVGIYGMLDDLWVMPRANVSQLNELEQNGERFKVFLPNHFTGNYGFTDIGVYTNHAFVVRMVE